MKILSASRLLRGCCSSAGAGKLITVHGKLDEDKYGQGNAIISFHFAIIL